MTYRFGKSLSTSGPYGPTVQCRPAAMPSRPPAPCTYPGCACFAVRMSRCAAHQRQPFSGNQTRNTSSRVLVPTAPPLVSANYKRYDSLYKTEQWRRMRAAHLAAYPLCVVCGAAGTVADHVVPHRGDARLFFNRGNLQTLCARDHQRKTAAEIRSRAAQSER